MEKSYNYELILERNKITNSAIFAMLGTFEQMEKTSILIPDETETKLVQYEKEVTPVGVDYSEFSTKFYKWHFSNVDSLSLSIEESKTYVELWHIAIEQVMKHKYNSGLNTEAMILYYNALLMTLVDIHKDKFVDSEGNFLNE